MTVEPDVGEKTDSITDLFDDLVRNRGAPAFELHCVEKFSHMPDRQRRDLRQRVVAYEYVARGFVKARSPTIRACLAVEELREFLAYRT